MIAPMLAPLSITMVGVVVALGAAHERERERRENKVTLY